jgi:drug/metabolite transporter (DMT)-like permease
MGVYIVMIGVGAFLERPALKGLTATQLNALMGIAMTAVAGIALAVKGPRLPMTKRTLGVLGVGVMIGAASVFYFLGLRGLPVSVASAASNASVVVTVVLSAIFLHQPLWPGPGRGAGPDAPRGNPPGALHRLMKEVPLLPATCPLVTRGTG